MNWKNWRAGIFLSLSILFGICCLLATILYALVGSVKGLSLELGLLLLLACLCFQILGRIDQLDLKVKEMMK